MANDKLLNVCVSVASRCVQSYVAMALFLFWLNDDDYVISYASHLKESMNVIES